MQQPIYMLSDIHKRKVDHRFQKNGGLYLSDNWLELILDMRFYNFNLFLLVFITSVCSVHAQEPEFLRGNIYDSKTGEPIIFATVRIKGKSVGVITNEDGGFRIPKEFWLERDTLLISSMGYQKKELPLLSLSLSLINPIRLFAHVFELSEAIIKSNKKKTPGAAQIVKYAINNIPENYPQEDFALVGYYRDYQNNNSEYVNLNEAIIEIRDEGFDVKNNFNSKFLMYENLKNRDFKIDSFAAKPYDYDSQDKIIPSAIMYNKGGNEFLTLIIHDAIRNYEENTYSFINNMANDFLKTHKFRIVKNTIFNESPIYEISIRFRKNGYLAKGKIFIDKNNFSIHRLDYSLYIQKMMNTSRYSTANDNDQKEKETDAGLVYQIVTEYRPAKNQKMFLNYISFRNKFIVNRPPIFRTIKFVIDLDNKCFKASLNRMPANLDKIKKKNFIISYKERQLPIEKIDFKKDSLQFLVYPDSNTISFQKEITELFTENDSLRISNLKYELLNIKDSLGNGLNESITENLEQYREYFVQEVIVKIDNEPNITSYMKRNLPLISPLQPIYSVEPKHNYWMNTPLKSSKN
ncbi:MAG: carboxypeptidase-like regulatory domain-containing protein [Eudoraea sp.]|uniref:carboxypeptidase-like regulatory domain-containing protein n=1 Tax=Eudoraea sp. TaxID=1979955 RepID=UPI003C73A332